MMSTKEIQEPLKIELDNNSIKFENFTEIYFPDNCVACGNTAQHRIMKHCFGTFSTQYDYKKDYYFSIPICDECENNLKVKSGLKAKSGKILLISTLIGLFISVALYFYTKSLLLSIGVFILSFVLPFIHYKKKTKTKIKFEDFLKMRISKDNVNSVELDFKDEDYARILREINFAKLKEDEIEEDNTQGDSDEN